MCVCANKHRLWAKLWACAVCPTEMAEESDGFSDLSGPSPPLRKRRRLEQQNSCYSDLSLSQSAALDRGHRGAAVGSCDFSNLSEGASSSDSFDYGSDSASQFASRLFRRYSFLFWVQRSLGDCPHTRNIYVVMREPIHPQGVQGVHGEPLR